MKKIVLFFFLLVGSITLIGCGDKGTTAAPTKAPTTAAPTTKAPTTAEPTTVDPNAYQPLASDVTGELWIALWSGSGETRLDLGHSNLTPTDLISQNDAAAYAVAKEFNKKYPNVIINGYFRTSSPSNAAAWTAELQTLADTNDIAWPSIWASFDLSGDVSAGRVADLSQFSNDPVYQTLNPSIMQITNYYGFQAGLPQYILPWGIYVNKSLADAKNIEVPDPDWTIEEYTEFTGHHERNVYYGAMDTPMQIITSGVNTYKKSLFNYDGGSVFLNMNSEEMRSLLPLIAEWNQNTFWGDWDKAIDEAGEGGVNVLNDLYATTAGSWDYNLWRLGYLLTFEQQPWMMGDCAEGATNKEWWAACVMDEWDYYPRPATDYVDENIGIVYDPMAVYNYCMDDSRPACTTEEIAKTKLAYTFAAFWVASNESFQARATQEFATVETTTDPVTGGEKEVVTTSSALNDSLPVVTGDAFDEQMELWYLPSKHASMKNKEGWAYVVELFKKGQFWDISDKTFPWFYTYEGSQRVIVYEFDNYWDENVNGGFQKGDAGFTDNILGRLEEWNTLANQRFAEAFTNLQYALMDYYGYSAEDFE